MFFAVLFAYLSDTVSKYNNFAKKLFWVLSFLCLFIPLGFRGYGVDYDSYLHYYEHVKSFGLNYFANYNFMPEPLYAVLNFIIANTIDQVQFVFFFSALIPLSLTYITFSKFRGRANLALCVWVYCFSYYLLMFGLVRICIAVGITSYSYIFLENRQLKKYLLTCILASLFHYSAIIMIPVYFLVHYEFKKQNRSFINLSLYKWCFQYLISTLFIFLLIYNIFPLVFGRFSWFWRYNIYFQAEPNWLIIKSQAFMLPMLVFIFLGGNYLNKKISNIKLYIKLVFITLGFTFGSIFFPIHRVCLYFMPVSCYLYSAFTNVRFAVSQKDQSTLIFLYFMLLSVMGIVWLQLRIFGVNTWRPYLIPFYLNISF